MVQTFYEALESVLKPNLTEPICTIDREELPKVDTTGRDQQPSSPTPDSETLPNSPELSEIEARTFCLQAQSTPCAYTSECGSKILCKIKQKRANEKTLYGRKTQWFNLILRKRTLVMLPVLLSRLITIHVSQKKSLACSHRTASDLHIIIPACLTLKYKKQTAEHGNFYSLLTVQSTMTALLWVRLWLGPSTLADIERKRHITVTKLFIISPMASQVFPKLYLFLLPFTCIKLSPKRNNVSLF